MEGPLRNIAHFPDISGEAGRGTFLTFLTFPVIHSFTLLVKTPVNLLG